MSKQKPTTPFILLPCSAEFCFRHLTDEQAGKLIKDLFAYFRRGVQKKYAVSNIVGYYFRSIVYDTDEMMQYYEDLLYGNDF